MSNKFNNIAPPVKSEPPTEKIFNENTLSLHTQAQNEDPPVSEKACFLNEAACLGEIFSQPDLVRLETSFIRLVLELNQEQSKNYLRNRKLYWNKAKEILTAVMKDLPDPMMWAGMSEVFYKEAEKRSYHPTYFEKVLAVVNEWGKFLVLHEKKRSDYQPIKAPKGFHKQRLVDAVTKAKRPLSKASKPLTWPMLCRAKGLLTNEDHWNYLFILFAFGLRPSELNKMVSDKSTFRVEEVEGVTVLHIFQGKLGQLDAQERWKHIPVDDPAQKKALDLILARQFKRPCADTVRRVLPPGYGLYAPRKGFALHMVRKGWTLEAASRYLGHSSTKTTEAYYVDRNELKTMQLLVDVKERRERRKKKAEVMAELRKKKGASS
jgi:integrase